MSRKYLIFITLLIGAFFYVRSADFQADGLNYNVLSESGHTVEVTFKSMANNYRDNAGYVSGMVVVPEEVTHQGVTYTVVTIGENAFGYCSDMTGVSIPETVTKIGTAAFLQTGLTEIRIPDSVTSLGDQIFAFDDHLVAVRLPSYLTKIPNHAFMLCTSLTSVVIPAGVTSIGAAAFNLCDNLNHITCLASVPPKLYEGGVFSAPNPRKSTTLYVPGGSIEAYRNAPVWQGFNVLSLTTSLETFDTDSFEAGATAVFNLDGSRTTLSGHGMKIVLTPHGPRKVIVH